MSDIRETAEQIFADADEIEATDPQLAAELRALAERALQYELRDNRHQVIIADAKRRKENGEDLDFVYRTASVELLATWPDAEAYGNALVALKAALLPTDSK